LYKFEFKLLLHDFGADIGAVDQFDKQFLKLITDFKIFHDVVVPLPENLVFYHLDLILIITVFLQLRVLSDVLQENLFYLLPFVVRNHLGQLLFR
jgi:hypothetical protein